jgi:hypothetical protein
MSPSRWWVAVLGGLTLFLALGLTGASPTQAAYPAAAPWRPHSPAVFALKEGILRQ